jgi:nitrate/nitrite transporter NarK
MSVPASAGWLAGLGSLGGVLAGIVYGSQAHRFGARTLAVALACLSPILWVPLLFANSVDVMAPLIVIAGLTPTRP